MLAASLLLSALLQAQDAKPMFQADIPFEASDEETELEFSVGLRVGGWRIGSFDALVPGGRRKIDQSLLFDAGIDLAAEYDPFTLTLVGDYGVGQDLQL